MLKLAFRLYPRILFWLLGNVVVVAACSWMVFQWQFREGVGGVLGGLLGDRLHSLGRLVHEQLTSTERQSWPALLEDLSERHGVEVALVTLPFRVVVGSTLQGPPELVEALRQLHREGQPGQGPPPPHPPGGMDDERGPPRDSPYGSAPGEETGRRPPPHWERDPGPPVEREPHLPTRLGSFMLSAGEPKLYYAGIRMPVNGRWPMRQGPLYLVIASPNLTGNGLFFELRPWFLGALGALLISALWWWPLVAGLTRSLRAVLAVTEQIARGRFEARVEERRLDELGALASGVNSMAAQIHGLVAGQKRFLGDIAHELCSPIARMELGLQLLDDEGQGVEAQRLRAVREELRQMSHLVDELLSFSRSSAQDASRPLSREGLLNVIEEALRVEAVPPELCSLQVEAGLKVLCSRELLLRALGNVLRNARRYAAGSALQISAARHADAVLLRIADQGPGVPADALPRLFEPFFRVDGSRQAETGGTGLGLAIVKSALESFGASVKAIANSPTGLIVEMQLPCA